MKTYTAIVLTNGTPLKTTTSANTLREAKIQLEAIYGKNSVKGIS